MSYLVSSRLWQRVSSLTLLLLIPTIQVPVFSQSVTPVLTASVPIRLIPVNYPDYQALQGLVKKYSCVVKIPNFGTSPLTQTEFVTILSSCQNVINQLVATNSNQVPQTDLKTLQRLQQKFAPELTTLKQELNLESSNADITTQNQSTTVTTKPSFRYPRRRLNSHGKRYRINGVARIMPQQPPISLPNGNLEAGADRIPSDGSKFNTENYDRIEDNPFRRVSNDPLSTFSIDVDTASYSNVRRFITEKQLPPKDAVRIEELINYFTYNYPQPKGDRPFSVSTEVTTAPWNPQHKLVQVGLQGKRLQSEKLPPSNLVFLIDVSGSMNEPNKLPLVKQSLNFLVNQLRPQDRVSLVAYAGNAGLVLPATPGSQKEKIRAAIDRLEAGGSTAGGAGIELAYKIAKQNFFKDGNNRVILATDGDFNVGVSSDADLIRMIEQKREQGIFLTVLGFGMGNYKDAKIEQLADKGNGHYAYIDTALEAKKVLVNDIQGTLFTIAKDVKIQVEFNPGKVQAYRLIGYENRLLQNQDFNDDKKDAGDIGAGHAVTVLYEIIPTGIESDVKLPKVDPLRYQKSGATIADSTSNELMLVKLRYKHPKDSTSQLITQTIPNNKIESVASTNLRFAAAVASYGMILRDSEYKGNANLDSVLKLATEAKGEDREGYREEFIRLVQNSKALMAQKESK